MTRRAYHLIIVRNCKINKHKNYKRKRKLHQQKRNKITLSMNH